jgi:hypothetical protein
MTTTDLRTDPLAALAGADPARPAPARPAPARTGPVLAGTR